MEGLAVSTPSPAASVSGIQTPPTPKHGYEDSWEPYQPRKSARISSRQQSSSSNRTPSPRSSSHRQSSNRHSSSLGSPRASKQKSYPANMTTPAISPRKKRVTDDSERRASGTLTVEGTVNAAAALGLTKSETRSHLAMANGMLPTPAKTPQKPPTEQNKANIQAIARNLFHSDEEVMPSPAKARSKKYTLDSFTTDLGDEDIQIYTDSHERIPEVDTSAENPFYGQAGPSTAEPTKRRSKRHLVHIPGEGSVTVDQAIQRDDGMLIVFRGKKQFRKFTENEDASDAHSGAIDEADAGLEGAVESVLRRPLTRSTIKPRLLFPAGGSSTGPASNVDDEEADTDIEDHVLDKTSAVAEEQPHTPMDLVDDSADTPASPKFAPASPPSTQRATRHGNKSSEEVSPMKPKRGGAAKRSPFDGWRRTKSTDHGQKRQGDSLAAEAAKRTRA